MTDANDFASWGVDLLKYDYCNAPDGRQDAMERYTVMGKMCIRDRNKYSDAIGTVGISLFVLEIRIEMCIRDS